MPKQLHTFFIESKNKRFRYRAHDRDEAFAKFFIDIEAGKIPLNQVDELITLWKVNKDSFKLRTTPLLFQLKLLSADVAAEQIMTTAHVDSKTANQMLLDYSFKDSRLLSIMERLKLQSSP